MDLFVVMKVTILYSPLSSFWGIKMSDELKEEFLKIFKELSQCNEDVPNCNYKLPNSTCLKYRAFNIMKTSNGRKMYPETQQIIDNANVNSMCKWVDVGIKVKHLLDWLKLQDASWLVASIEGGIRIYSDTDSKEYYFYLED